MSVPEGAREDNKFTLPVKAEELAEHTLRVTKNEKLFLPQYHYLKATSFDDAVEEAGVFYRATQSAPSPLFYVVDCEYSGITKLEKKLAGTAASIVEAFLFELRNLAGKDIRIGCYIGHHLYKVWNLEYGDFDYIWIPRYGSNSGEKEVKPYYPCDLWQFTSKGKLAGVNGRVDLNALTGRKPLSFFLPQDNEEEGEIIMKYDPNKVIQVALNEVGYLEKKDKNNLDDKTANAGSKNCTKYARDLDALGFYNGKKQGVAWCDIFVDWCFVQAYGLDAALKLTNQPLGKSNCGAGCKYSRNYYKKKGRLFDKPQAGDQIFFWPKDAIGGPAVAHTGLVYDVDGTYVYTIEGNTSGANGVVANGGGVCKKKYKLTYNRIAGYGRPEYGMTVAAESEKQEEEQTNSWTKTVTIHASNGGRVNIRKGHGTNYSRITSVKPGTKFEYVATAENGWNAIVYSNQVAWVSGKYSIVA